MIYFIKPNDTLNSISQEFNTSIKEILSLNIICNPDRIYPGQPIIIPREDLELPIVGAIPYYIVLPGDTLYCLSKALKVSTKTLSRANQIQNPKNLPIGTELITVDTIPRPSRLVQQWRNMGGQNCEELTPSSIHGIYYIGSFYWEAIGRNALPFLVDLLEHPCDTVRYYSIISLGRIGIYAGVEDSLNELLNDPVDYITNIARIALKRIELLKVYSRRLHLLTSENKLYSEPTLASDYITLEEGSPVISLKWSIPSPSGEEGPRGGIQIYDYIQDLESGKVGFLPRLGFNEITLI